jgi:D-amino-acid oxidase
MSGIEAARTAVSAPDWADQLDGFRMCEPNELPDGFATGWRFTAPIVDMPVYLDYLQRRLAASGGAIETRRLKSLSEATAVAPMVVNCTGMGARTLVPDPELVPIRGQLVVVENPGLTEFFSEDTGPSSPDLLHIYPQGKTAVLGGLAAAGDATAEPDPEVAASILARCCAVEPRLRNARVIGHRAGLRPTRPFVRVEQEQVGSAIVIHNYGHGGAGVTLSWGCATEVVSLAGAR